MSSSANIAAKTRELIIQLSRGNADPAQALALGVQTDLNLILTSDLQPDNPVRHGARQTMFAIEEVLAMIDQSDLRGAWQAARDAAKEWRETPQTAE